MLPLSHKILETWTRSIKRWFQHWTDSSTGRSSLKEERQVRWTPPWLPWMTWRVSKLQHREGDPRRAKWSPWGEESEQWTQGGQGSSNFQERNPERGKLQGDRKVGQAVSGARRPAHAVGGRLGLGVWLLWVPSGHHSAFSFPLAVGYVNYLCPCGTCGVGLLPCQGCAGRWGFSVLLVLPVLVRQDPWPGPSISCDADRGHRAELACKYRPWPLVSGNPGCWSPRHI